MGRTWAHSRAALAAEAAFCLRSSSRFCNLSSSASSSSSSSSSLSSLSSSSSSSLSSSSSSSSSGTTSTGFASFLPFTFAAGAGAGATTGSLEPFDLWARFDSTCDRHHRCLLGIHRGQPPGDITIFLPERPAQGRLPVSKKPSSFFRPWKQVS